MNFAGGGSSERLKTRRYSEGGVCVLCVLRKLFFFLSLSIRPQGCLKTEAEGFAAATDC